MEEVGEVEGPDEDEEEEEEDQDSDEQESDSANVSLPTATPPTITEPSNTETSPTDLAESDPTDVSSSSSSRSDSPASLAKGTAGLNIKETASNDVKKLQQRQKRMYHSKKSTRRAGRAHGSKAKQDVRYIMAPSAGWD